MAHPVSYLPEGYPPITPYLSIRGASEAIAFYKKAFKATERMCLPAPEGKIGHAELVIGTGVIMLADECAEAPHVTPPTVLSTTTISLLVYVEDVDAFVAHAVEAGATLISPAEDKFYGDRTAGLKDPYGHVWYIATHIEDVTPEEMSQRAAALV